MAYEEIYEETSMKKKSKKMKINQYRKSIPAWRKPSSKKKKWKHRRISSAAGNLAIVKAESVKTRKKKAMYRRKLNQRHAAESAKKWRKLLKISVKKIEENQAENAYQREENENIWKANEKTERREVKKRST